MGAHAVEPPSGAHWWTECSGSLYHIRKDGITSKETEASKDGTLTHAWNDKILTAALTNKAPQKLLQKILDEIEEDDRRLRVLNYFNFILKLEASFKKGCHSFTRFIEKKVEYTDTNWGTLDYGLVCDRRKKNSGPEYLEAILVDYKDGRGEVEVVENKQLANYLIALDKLFKGQIQKFYVYIYQPKTPTSDGKPYKRWVITRDKADEWIKFFDGRLAINKRVREGKEEAYYRAGDWCHFCPVKPVCRAYSTALKRDSLKILDEAGPVIPKIESVPIESLVKIYAKRNEIKALLESIGAYLTNRAESHPATAKELKKLGWKLSESRPIRQWIKNEGKVIQVLKKLGIKQLYKKKLIGITDVENEVGKGKIGKITQLSETHLQLAPIDDTRDEIGTDDRTLLSDLSE